MFVMTAVAIPRFIIIVKLGIYNTWLAHILPLIAMPVGLFLVKQFVDGIPDALIEAAVVDGAGDITIKKSYYSINKTCFGYIYRAYIPGSME